MRTIRCSGILLVFWSLCAMAAPPARLIQTVTLDRPSFNPSANEVVTIVLRVSSPGTAAVLIVDRDGFAVRSLATAVPVEAVFSVSWNGRDAAGEVVADEAYSLKIDWRSRDGKTETYFPAGRPAAMQSLTATYYDRRGGTLSYRLPSPSRVHLQAGTSVVDPKTKSVAGAVMKTIVNREPRAAGAIAEHWNGFDESGSVYVPDLKDFVVSIAATPLPATSIIAYGNRQRTFLDAARARGGRSLLPPMPGATHHARLDALSDVSPPLAVEVLNGQWSDAERVWVVSDAAMRVRVAPAGPTAELFRRQPGRIYAFLNGRNVSAAKTDVPSLDVPLPGSGTSVVTLNWWSEYGPVAANTVRVRRSGR